MYVITLKNKYISIFLRGRPMFSQELVKEKVGAVLVSHEIQSSQLRTARKEWKVLASAAGALESQ